ncbi:hypothetical protein PHISCL_09631 [Aspergillus sclerotialis]|uniref:Inheritance of peroxisomes protein 1 n=1 Tax=Aspergillus sclerotialis TaxID=2070753 RepID=A0A3A2Z9S2_9EURO|nr:hypothetical protein PHISCL_09631 [Aspergillus sclerotialis]
MPDLDAPPTQYQQPLRRSATLPTKLVSRKQSTTDSLNASGNDLYYHPYAKIVHFSPRAIAPIPSSSTPSDFDYPVDTIETLPWRSPTERTVALGPLRLEKGLTVFLKCGSVVHAILKNSQCWCVDGASTFVLRIRPLTYYRIEIPNETEEDKSYVAELKSALPKILRYEVTPCPFKRGFTVEIPEEAKVPRRKKAWQPRIGRESAPSCLFDVPETTTINSEGPDSSSAGEETDGNTTDASALASKDGGGTPLETIRDNDESSEPESIPISSETVIPRRSVTEPQQSFHSLLARFETSPEPHVDDASYSSSVDSFHSARPSSLLPPSSSHSNSTAPTSVACTEHIQSDTQSCESPQSTSAKDIDSPTLEKPELPDLHTESNSSNATPYESAKQTPTSSLTPPPDTKISTTKPTSTPTSSGDNLSDMSAEFRRRTKATKERDISPMPPASILCQSNPDYQETFDSLSIIQKTCTLVLVPPIQLLLILIHIAARIVIGPALSAAMRDLNKKLEDRVESPQDAVDDFGLPLAVEASDEAGESEKSKGPEESVKSDPWDLD